MSKASKDYAAKNPLGGPAKMFDAIASRLRAGEDYWDVLADYDIRFVAGVFQPDHEWRALYDAVNKMMAPLGYHGTISRRDDRVQAVMDALHAIDGGTVLTPNDGLGVCVLVHGAVVAWFAEFTEEARDWCTENYFGEWMTWRGAAPVPNPLTAAEQADCEIFGEKSALRGGIRCGGYRARH